MSFQAVVLCQKDRVLLRAGYRFIRHKNYLIFYLVNEKTVNVMAFFNQKKNYMHIMKRHL